MTVRTVSLALGLLFGSGLQAEARGSAVNGDAPWLATEVESLLLPAETFLGRKTQEPFPSEDQW